MSHYLPSSSPKLVSLEAIAPIIAASKHSASAASIKFCLYVPSFATCSAAISAEHLLQVVSFLVVSYSPHEAALTIKHDSISAPCSLAVKYDNPTVFICFKLIARYGCRLLADGLQPSCRSINCLSRIFNCFHYLKREFKGPLTRKLMCEKVYPEKIFDLIKVLHLSNIFRFACNAVQLIIFYSTTYTKGENIGFETFSNRLAH